MIRSVMSVTTTVSSRVDTTENHKLESRPMFLLGSRRWMASLVSSTRTASIGLMNKFTLNAPPTAAKPAASPARGCRPTLTNVTAASGIRTR
jgi:hypothetical protein